MSGSASLTLEQGILQHTLGIAAMAFPAQVYVALCAAGLPPSESVGGVEAFGGGYARVAATFALLASPTNIAANTASVEFPLATAAWGSLGYFEIWSAQTGGSRLYWGGLVDPVTGNAMTLNVSAGDIVRFSAGALAVQAVPFTPTVSAGVSSFNTRTGAVILSNSDVVGVLPPSANPPLMDGAAAVGTSAAWARGDHVHPSDAGIAANAAAAGHNIGRNLLHNPLFRVAQRGAGPWTTNSYTADRWAQYFVNGTMQTQIIPMSDAGRAQIGDEASSFILQCQFTGSATAGSTSQIYQPIEGVRRLAGKTVTASFWAWSSAAMKLGLSLDQGFGTGGSPSATVAGAVQTVTLSTTPTRYSLTFAVPSVAGKTLGTNGNDATTFDFYLSSQTIAAVGVQSTLIQMWGLQLEIGSVATPLEKPDPQQDLAKCQRFYSVGQIYSGGYSVAGGTLVASAPYITSMRGLPTIVITSNFNSNISGFATSNVVGGVAIQGTATVTGATVLNCVFAASADL